MASQFLVAGDLFVEVVDNADGGGIPQKRLETLSQAHRDGSFDRVAFPFERSNGYNGVRQLYSRKGPQENIFRSGWGSSLNFEFVFDASGTSMAPRWIDGKMGSPPTPSQLTRLDDNSVRLETSVPEPHRVDVSTVFALVAPHYIDLETTIVAQPNAFAGDWLGLFWASYIHAPENRTTCFRGRRDRDGPVEWIESLEEIPPNPCVFASETDPLLPVEPNPNGRLFHNIRPIRYVSPMFYGRWRNMMLEMMFTCEDNLRFAIQPTGGGLKNPAWDFAVVIRHCQPLKQYHFRARVVFKPFVSPEDAWEEYQRWMETTK
ncbi:MAG: hypothetical protein O7E52_00055 [Candidatus Poribacteria bacterium]|nr:hypothetical protein [Candidatus Poribacteria bacterium]